MAYGDFKDLKRRTGSDKILRDKAFSIAKNPEYDSKFDKAFRFLLCVIDIFSKYVWVVLLKDEKGISIVNDIQKILKEYERKPNEIWVDKGSEFLQ